LRKIHTDELSDMYLSSNIVRVIKYKESIGRSCSTYGEGAWIFRGYRWEIERERDHLEDPRLEDNNIKMDLQKGEWGHVLD